MENLADKKQEPAQTLYKIGEASNLSGVPIETIRIWERRYKAVEPIRTVGRHRKYTDDNIQYLAALKAIVDSGRRIGQVVKMPEEEALLEAGKIKALEHMASEESAPATVTTDEKLSEAQCAVSAKPVEEVSTGHTPWQPRY